MGESSLRRGRPGGERELAGGCAAKREKHLTLKGEMLVKFKPYLICDTLVNNCPGAKCEGGRSRRRFPLVTARGRLG